MSSNQSPVFDESIKPVATEDELDLIGQEAERAMADMTAADERDRRWTGDPLSDPWRDADGRNIAWYAARDRYRKALRMGKYAMGFASIKVGASPGLWGHYQTRPVNDAEISELREYIAQLR